jgi:hypothetical protein
VKRALAVLALCACVWALMALAWTAQAAPAKVAFIQRAALQNGNNSDAATTQVYSGFVRQLIRNQRIVRQVMDRLGINYTIIQAIGTGGPKTEQVRLGMIPNGAGVTAQYDGVILPSYCGSAERAVYSLAATAPALRCDSLSRVALGGYQVPALALIDNSMQFATGNAVNVSFDEGHPTGCLTDTAGIVSDQVAGQAKTSAYGQNSYSMLNPTTSWYALPYNNGWLRNPTPPVGGLRLVLGKMQTAWILNYLRNSYGTNCTNPDSLVFTPTAASDSMVVWDRLWKFNNTYSASLQTAKTVTYCDWGGNGASDDSLSANVTGMHKSVSEGTFSTLLFGLAHYDSLVYAASGKRLINKPIQFAVVVEGGLSRGLRRGARGIAPGDTALYYTDLDSLAKWGVPITFAVNPESAAAYPADVIHMMKNGQARFTPQVWNGVDKVTATTIIASGHARDVFGRRQPRAIFGDSSFTRPVSATYNGADTSFVTMQRWAQARNDSIFGGGRRSACLVAPEDDWSPLGATQSVIDSLFYAARQLGYTTIVADGQRATANVFGVGCRAEGDTLGWYNKQARYPTKNFVGQYDGGSFNVLCHNGFILQGGARQIWCFTATATDTTSNWANSSLSTTSSPDEARAWMGICGSTSNYDHDVFQWDGQGLAGNVPNWDGVAYRHEDRIRDAAPPIKGYVVRVNASALSGDPANPARVGFWLIRDLWTAAQEINRAAGHTVVLMTYPEYVDPR